MATGRPKLTDEEKKERSVQKYLETANSEFVKDLIESGEYKKYLKQAVLNTVAAGKMDGFKYLNDYNNNKPKEVHEIETIDKTRELSKEELYKEAEKMGLDVTKLFDK
ncbi:MAG: hypothetical protein IPL26_12985 [Leptospiraceae bacterium]|nr:hypothetical protein [Leptospiraceae bacterium]